MTAQIIQFPRKYPLEEHELPEQWSPWVRSHYVHLTYDGFRTHDVAFEQCEELAKRAAFQ